MEKIIALMREIGFTSNEAKAYVALLKTQPATGYEVATRSGVPRSAIYNVLAKLKDAGIINAVHHKPARYIALPPAQLQKLMTDRFSSCLESLRGSLDEVVGSAEAAFLWQIHGYREVMDSARGLIERSTKQIALSIWGREAQELEDALQSAAGRGVAVVVFSLTDLPEITGTTFSYDINAAELEKHWGHKLILLIDNKMALVGTTELQSSQAIITEESAVVDMALNNLVLDITLFGQRKGMDVSHHITALQSRLAPIDELISDPATP